MFSVSITVDVDGESGLPDGGRGYRERLTSRSERRYGLRRGLPRVLAVLDEFEAPATWYVPGVVAERHPDEIAALAQGRHEVGHHGHAHRRPDTLAPAEQRADVAAGLAAIEQTCGTRPAGYRAPGWELTPATLDCLVELGFAYDSSLMGDDRPYPLRGGALVELPVHWSLDDAPHFAATVDPAGLLAVWLEELRIACAEERHVTYTLHPDILGRPGRVDVLRRLVDAAGRLDGPLVAHGAVAASAARA